MTQAEAVSTLQKIRYEIQLMMGTHIVDLPKLYQLTNVERDEP